MPKIPHIENVENIRKKTMTFMMKEMIELGKNLTKQKETCQ